MSEAIFVFYILSAAYVFSQFGGKLTARNALTWILIYALMGLAIFKPEWLLPLTQAMGIQVVSNGVFAGLILFLSFQAMQESAFTTRLFRKLRDISASAGLAQFSALCQSDQESSRALLVVPSYNEEENLPTLIQDLSNCLEKGLADYLDVCIIDDGSRDNSESVLNRMRTDQKNVHPQIYWVHLPSNSGVSGVLLTGIRIAKKFGYSEVIQFDADGQHPTGALLPLLEFHRKCGADLTIGSRFVNAAENDESTTGLRRLGSSLISLVMRVFSTTQKITDPTSGFRVYSQRAMALLQHEVPDEYPEPESIALILSGGLKVSEFQVKMNSRQRGVSSLAGLRGPKFMLKVMSSLLGLRIRTWLS